ncbi:DUF3967 domain-containing protein [Niallia nealsonii]|uniref:DNA-binding protein n=1 Tax=Niallia nealsonii TaxID=115979 RepID=A0A2N0YX73_9BACI|nr:DUF3967 domain-containing protein [Niallia nealsonii]PKG21861.1 DNA-binding protein [Niallia nealsonii]
MFNDMDMQEKVYSAKEVSVLLGIQNTTVRKYAQLLEKAGYHIHKNELGHRGFFNKDVLILRQIIELAKHPDMSLENAIKVIVSTNIEGDMSDRDTKELAETPYITKEEFEEYQNKQMEFQKAMFEKQEKYMQELIERLEKQEDYIQNKLEKRDQLLLEHIRDMQAEKQIAASKEKNKWWKFWN